MCVAAWALHAHPQWSLVLASNRDEFFDRASAPLQRWGEEPLWAGRDLQGGGTWLGAHGSGRVALLTNVREPARAVAGARTRGALALQALRGQALDLDAPRQGWNLVVLDTARGSGLHLSNLPELSSRTLQGGHQGLSNASLDTPWPKLLRLQTALRSALALDDAGMLDALWASLADTTPAPDAELPSTGVSREVERALSSIRVDALAPRYGTRSSIVLRVARDGSAQMIERRWAGDGAALGETQLVFRLPPAGASAAAH